MEPWKLEPAKDLGLPLDQRLRSVRRECGLIETAGHVAWWASVRVALRVLHRLEVIGRAHLDRPPPFVIAANHCSHLDALVLASPLPWRLRDCTFPVAAGDTFFETRRASLFAALAMNALPLWRKKVGHHAMEDLRRRLMAEGCVYVLFPEGSRSRDGSMHPFKAGLGMLLAGTEVPVIPCHLAGTFNALPPDRKIPRPGKIVMRVGAPLRFSDIANARDGWEQVARETEGAVRHLAAANQAGATGKPSA